MKRLLSCAILVLVCGGFYGGVWAEVLEWDVDECYTTNFVDVLLLKNSSYDAVMNNESLLHLSGVWRGLDRYEHGVTGVGHTEGNVRKSLVGANYSTFFGGNIPCGFTLEITSYSPQQTGTFRMQCSGTSTPFQVSGTVTRVECGFAVAIATSRLALPAEQESRGLAGELRNNELQ